VADRLQQDDASRPKARRTPRFVLPDDHHDDRTAARIEAFLDGPAGRSRRRDAAINERGRPRRRHELDTRPDWTTALRLESRRHARYARPSSVLLIELDRDLDAESLDRQAGEVANLIRLEARDTDRAARMGAASFRVLLPETSARAARHAVERIERIFQLAHAGQTEPAQLRIDVVAPTRGGSLEDALADAERRIGR